MNVCSFCVYFFVYSYGFFLFIPQKPISADILLKIIFFLFPSFISHSFISHYLKKNYKFKTGTQLFMRKNVWCTPLNSFVVLHKKENIKKKTLKRTTQKRTFLLAVRNTAGLYLKMLGVISYSEQQCVYLPQNK